MIEHHQAPHVRIAEQAFDAAEQPPLEAAVAHRLPVDLPRQRLDRTTSFRIGIAHHQRRFADDFRNQFDGATDVVGDVAIDRALADQRLQLRVDVGRRRHDLRGRVEFDQRDLLAVVHGRRRVRRSEVDADADALHGMLSDSRAIGAHQHAARAQRFDRPRVEAEPVGEDFVVVFALLRRGAARAARRVGKAIRRLHDRTLAAGAVVDARDRAAVSAPSAVRAFRAPSRTSPHARFILSSALITAARSGRFLKNARAVARRTSIFSSSVASAGVGSTTPARVVSCFHTWRKSLAISSVPAAVSHTSLGIGFRCSASSTV